MRPAISIDEERMRKSIAQILPYFFISMVKYFLLNRRIIYIIPFDFLLYRQLN